MDNRKIYNLVIIFLSILCFLTSLRIIRDYDFWWHLETGKWILKHRRLPESDPFSYTTFISGEGHGSERGRAILKSYWLAQVVLYKIYNWFSISGVVLFRSLLFLLVFLIISLYIVRQNIQPVIMVFMLLSVMLLLAEFINTRPKMFSYLFAVLAFIALESYRKHGRLINIGILAVLMVIWANMHGGYLLGIWLTVVYIAGILFFHEKNFRLPDAARFRKAFPLFVAICAGFVNPLPFGRFLDFIGFYGSTLSGESYEMLSPISVFHSLGYRWILFPVLIIIDSFVLIYGFKRVSFEHLVLLISTLAASLISLRFTIYFVFFSAMIVGDLLNDIANKRIIRRFLQISCILLLISNLLSVPDVKAAVTDGYDRDLFPVRAVQYIKERNLTGNMFNDVTWGGYLLHELYPEHKVFIDTRTLNPDIYMQYLAVILGSQRKIMSMPEWLSILDTYGVNFIVHSVINPYDGKPFPFINLLKQEKGWQQIYYDGHTVIYVKHAMQKQIKHIDN